MSKSIYDRRYLGVLVTAENYRKLLIEGGRRLINFHEKHLRCYLRGDQYFTFGYEKDEEGRNIRPKTFRVQQQLLIKDEL